MTQFQRELARIAWAVLFFWVLLNAPKFIGDACVLIQGRW